MRGERGQASIMLVAVVGLLVAGAMVLFAFGNALGAPAADHALARAAAVRGRRVERAHARRPRRVHDRARLVLVRSLTPRRRGRAEAAEVAAPEHEPRQLDVASPDAATFHPSGRYASGCAQALL